MSNKGGIMWPVTDAQIDKDELDAMDGVDLGIASSAGQTLTIGSTGVSSYGSYHPGPMITDSDTDTIMVKGNMTISDVDGTNKIDVGESIRAMNERLLVLTPNFEAMEQYPALKDAYDQYKMLEKLLMEQNNDPEKKS